MDERGVMGGGRGEMRGGRLAGGGNKEREEWEGSGRRRRRMRRRRRRRRRRRPRAISQSREASCHFTVQGGCHFTVKGGVLPLHNPGRLRTVSRFFNITEEKKVWYFDVRNLRRRNKFKLDSKKFR